MLHINKIKNQSVTNKKLKKQKQNIIKKIR
jgi:hypothetical protein